MSNAWAGGSTRRWRKIRAAILAHNLATNGGRCQLALPGTWTTTTGDTRRCLGRADCVHHMLGKGVTGDDPRYLVASCTPCNLATGEPAKRPDPPGRPMTRW